MLCEFAIDVNNVIECSETKKIVAALYTKVTHFRVSFDIWRQQLVRKLNMQVGDTFRVLSERLAAAETLERHESVKRALSSENEEVKREKHQIQVGLGFNVEL